MPFATSAPILGCDENSAELTWYATPRPRVLRGTSYRLEGENEKRGSGCAGVLKREGSALRKEKAKGIAPEEKTLELAELANRWDALYNELIVNIGYLPLTIHW